MNSVNPEQKEKILQESYEKGCVITQLAKKYGIPESTIYGWRGKDKQQEKNIKTEPSANFIEVHVKENVAKAKLKKVELIYEKFRIEIEGEISSTKIGPIMQILEGE
jgi:transposase-like protein